jgi:oligosaccharyl transferase (archaeosortase A-associated)
VSVSEASVAVEFDGPSSNRQAAWGLAVVAIGAFALRVFLNWPSVFGQEYVAFAENDAWYHMRLVDALVRDFPWRIWHDPYLVHPGGEGVNAGPMLDWIIAAAALVLGAGAPSPRLIDVVGAFVPPVLGSLMVIPVYVLGRELFSRRAGLWAGLMIAVMPGQQLQRSLLGFTDHHCAEVLFSTAALMFLVLGLKSHRKPSSLRSLSVAAGLALGAYLLTWGGGVLFVAILGAFAVLQLLVDSWRGVESEGVVAAVVPMLLIAAVIVAPWAGTRPQFNYQLGSLLGSATVIWALGVSRRIMQRRRWNGTTWAAATVGVTLAVTVLALLMMGDSARSLISDASRVSPFRTREFVAEALPLMASDQWRPVPLWKEFTSSLVLAIGGCGWLLARAGLRSPNVALLGLWTATMVVATFGQVRFAYYLAVNVALIGGLACDLVLRAVGSVRTSTATRALAASVLACVVIIPGVPQLRRFHNGDASLNPNWHDALSWLGANTPEPFSNRAEYYRPSPAGSATASYSVLAFWDYGYWITRIARRVPVTNPRQTGIEQAAAFLLSSNERDANRVVERLEARYIAVNWQLRVPRTPEDEDGKRSVFDGLMRAGRRNLKDYCGLFSEQSGSTGTAGMLVVYCYPEYYRTMAMRLYLYGGRAATPETVSVLSYRRDVRDGMAVNVVTGDWSFATYEEATRFVTTSGRTDMKIVSKDPLVTCVPLEALANYTSVFRALERDGTDPDDPPAVQLFEYHPHRQSPPEG